MSAKTFDFTHPDFKKTCVPKQQYLLQNFNKPITEDEFVEAFQTMPKHLHWSWGHSPHAAKDQYKRLTEDFGLFREDAKVIT